MHVLIENWWITYQLTMLVTHPSWCCIFKGDSRISLIILNLHKWLIFFISNSCELIIALQELTNLMLLMSYHGIWSYIISYVITSIQLGNILAFRLTWQKYDDFGKQEPLYSAKICRSGRLFGFMDYAVAICYLLTWQLIVLKRNIFETVRKAKFERYDTEMFWLEHVKEV